MDTETTKPAEVQEPKVQDPPAVVEPASSLSFRAKALQTACESLREQVKAMCATNDQPGYHLAEGWLAEAERALRKVATQCEAAETVHGEV